ncbi:hypothetical protein J2T17_003616 [Paenibacillus mucilaginosus]
MKWRQQNAEKTVLLHNRLSRRPAYGLLWTGGDPTTLQYMKIYQKQNV